MDDGGRIVSEAVERKVRFAGFKEGQSDDDRTSGEEDGNQSVSAAAWTTVGVVEKDVDGGGDWWWVCKGWDKIIII